MVIGNIDPSGIICSGTPGKVRKETLELLNRCGKYSNFVISSGCDIPPTASLENIQAFFDAVNEYYI